METDKSLLHGHLKPDEAIEPFRPCMRTVGSFYPDIGQKKFTLPRTDFKAIDKKSVEAQLLNNYAMWIVNDQDE